MRQEQTKPIIPFRFGGDLCSHTWAILPTVLDDMIRSLQINESLFKQEALMPLFEVQSNSDKRYDVEDGVAIIKIQGTLSKKLDIFSIIFGNGSASAGMLIEDIKQALNDRDVKGILLLIDSPGGQVEATVDLADLIYNSRDKKPFLAFADGRMLSASYWIGSAANYTVASNVTAEIGSIGVLMVHSELTKAAENLGETFTIFASGKYKAAGNKFKPLSKDDKSYIQSIIDYTDSLFIHAVSRNLGVSEETVVKMKGEGKIYIGQQAVDMGLVNEIAGREQAMEILKNMADGKGMKQIEQTKTNAFSQKSGGETNMNLEEMQQKMSALQIELDSKTSELEAYKSDAKVKELNDKIGDLEASVTTLTDANQSLTEKVSKLEESGAESEALVGIGNQALESLRTDITALTRKAKGGDFNEAFTKKQIDAMGNDFEALTMMKIDAEKTMAKIFKTGGIDPDASSENVDIKDMPREKKYEIGRKIGVNAKVIPMNNG